MWFHKWLKGFFTNSQWFVLNFHLLKIMPNKSIGNYPPLECAPAKNIWKRTNSFQVIADNAMVGLGIAIAKVMSEIDQEELQLIDDATKTRCPDGCPNQSVGDVSWGDAHFSMVPQTDKATGKIQTGKIICTFGITASVEIVCSKHAVVDR